MWDSQFDSSPALLTDSVMMDNDTYSTIVSGSLNHSLLNNTTNFPVPMFQHAENDSITSSYVEYLQYFNSQYRKVHGEICISICIFGVITNILNIIVLTRKNMISPTNAILTGMAVSDCAVIASYIPYLGAYHLREASADQYSFGWAVYTLCHAHITVVFHTISVWLTVLLAIWRYLTVRSAGNSRWYCSMTRAKIAIVLTYAIVPVFCIPVFLCFSIYPYQQLMGSGTNATNITLYKVDMVKTHHDFLANINFWVFSVFNKLIPCILLTCLSLALIRILIEARKRKERLLGAARSGLNNNTHNHNHHRPNNAYQAAKPVGGGQNAHNQTATNGNNQLYLEIGEQSPTESLNSSCKNPNILFRIFSTLRCNCLESDSICNPDRIRLKLRKSSSSSSSAANRAINLRHHHHHHAPHNVPPPSHRSQASSSGNSERTTRMLIAVLIVFLVCESPAGVLALLSAINRKAFDSDIIYFSFGEVMDMLALMNSAVNFILYCFMSQQFRKTFSQLFCICWWTEEVGSGGVGGPVSGMVPPITNVPRPATVIVPSSTVNNNRNCANNASIPLTTQTHAQQVDISTQETTCNGVNRKNQVEKNLSNANSSDSSAEKDEERTSLNEILVSASPVHV